MIASRQLPSMEWRTDPGWAAVLQVIPLRNFRPEESHAYLTSRGVPEPLQTEALGFTHGNPLALSLLTDLYRLQPERFTVRHPDVIQALVRRLLDDVPTPLHRRALEVCAHLRVTTEDRLAEALMISDARELFDWLRSLSFIETGSAGVFPHDLTRVIEADLRWRSPERFRQLHEDVRRGIVRQLQHGSTAERQMAFSDLLFLHRNNPIMRPLFQWDTLGRRHLLQRRSMTTTWWSTSCGGTRATRRQRSSGIGYAGSRTDSGCSTTPPGRSSALFACSKSPRRPRRTVSATRR
jgi:hypothetical protein